MSRLSRQMFFEYKENGCRKQAIIAMGSSIFLLN